MASTRAQEIAEVLWELKRAGKVGQYTAVARRAGFTAGSNGRNVLTTMKTVRRDWPHLQWWRAVPDNGIVETAGELATALLAGGFTLEAVDDTKSKITGFEDLVMNWPEPVDENPPPEPAAAAPAKPKAAKESAPKEPKVEAAPKKKAEKEVKAESEPAPEEKPARKAKADSKASDKAAASEPKPKAKKK